MNDLSPEAQALLEVGRQEAPRAGLKLQVKAQVLAQAAAAPATASAMGQAAAGGVFKALAGGAVALGLAAGVVWSIGPQSSELPPNPPAPPSVMIPAAAPASPSQAAPEPVAPAQPAPVRVEAQGNPDRPVAVSRPKAPRTRVTPAKERPAPLTVPAASAEASAPATQLDVARLAQEALLLKQVRVALRDADYAAVLHLTQQHAREFPQGSLRIERLAAQAMAQCAQGEVERGRATRAQLAEAAPSSVHLPRVDAACDPK